MSVRNRINYSKLKLQFNPYPADTASFTPKNNSNNTRNKEQVADKAVKAHTAIHDTFSSTNSTKNKTNTAQTCKITASVCILIFSVYFFSRTVIFYLNNETEEAMTFFFGYSKTTSKQYRVASWNVGQVATNPFEYWLNLPSSQAFTDKESQGKNNDDTRDELSLAVGQDYYYLMNKFEAILRNPRDSGLDVRIDQVFTEGMFKQLLYTLGRVYYPNADKLIQFYEEEYRNKTILSQFLLDEEITSKGLFTEIDKLTLMMETKPLPYHPQPFISYRPTVMNCYSLTFQTFEDFWEHWKAYMIRLKDVVVNQRKDALPPIYQVQNLSRKEYPALTETEEKYSRPLQILMLAIYDSALVHVMSSIFSNDISVWQHLRQEICTTLFWGKHLAVENVIQRQYMDRDIIFVQNAAHKFYEHGLEKYYKFAPVQPSLGNQTSLIFLKKTSFPYSGTKFEDVTAAVLTRFKNPVLATKILDNGLLVLKSPKYNLVLASFLSDVDGKATKPVVQAVHHYVSSINKQETKENKYTIIFGLDAKTHVKPDDEKLGFTDFIDFYRQLGFSSCWELEDEGWRRVSKSSRRKAKYPEPTSYTTSFAKTVFQPMQSEAVSWDQLEEQLARNPTDFVLFSPEKLKVMNTMRDNTGKGSYLKTGPYQSLRFPSDHAIVSVDLGIL